jgi:hypothetical protein
VAPDEAHVTLEHEFPAPPSLLWDWLNDPMKRNEWSFKSKWVVGDRPDGRTGIASSNHCKASSMTEYILDWRPFRYFTVHYTLWRLHFTLTNQLKPTSQGTRLLWYFRLDGSLPGWIVRKISQFFVFNILKMPSSFQKLARLLTDPVNAETGRQH